MGDRRTGGSVMAYWLFKSEPATWSWAQQKEKGRDGEAWTGVRNYQARNHMRAMKLGDKGFFYHSNEGREIVGIVEVCALAHPDATVKKGTKGEWDCVDIRALQDVPRPVTLDVIKTEPRLADMVLVNNSRLSVQPVTAAEWAVICDMGGVKRPPRLSDD
jgi:predicted RNA-binding protein with PUA-like domain